jgi:hypothetical protein
MLPETRDKLIVAGASMAALAGAFLLYKKLVEKTDSSFLSNRLGSPRPELEPSSNKQSTLGTIKADLKKSAQMKNANFPMTDEGRTYHVGTKSGEVCWLHILTLGRA